MLLPGLNERQGLEEFIERPETSREGDHRAGAHKKMHLADREVMKLKGEFRRHIGIRPLLVRERDVESDALSFRFPGSPVSGFHDSGSSSGDDHEVALFVVLGCPRDEAGEFPRLVVVP